MGEDCSIFSLNLEAEDKWADVGCQVSFSNYFGSHQIHRPACERDAGKFRYA